MDHLLTLNPKTTTTESDVCYFCYQDIDKNLKNLENGNRDKVDPDASSSSLTLSPVTLHDLCDCKGSTRVIHAQCFLRYLQHSSYSGVCTVCKSVFRFSPDALARLRSIPVDHENDVKNRIMVLITVLQQQQQQHDRGIINYNNNNDVNDYYYYYDEDNDDNDDNDEESPFRPPRRTTLFRRLLKKYTFTVIGSSMFFLSLLQFSVFFFFVFNNLSISFSS